MAMTSGHKQTEVGTIPEDWEICPVASRGEVVTGKALAANGPGKQRPYLRTKNVFDGRIDIDDVLTMPMTDDQFEQFRLRKGDVLLNEGQSLELVGRCAVYQDEYPDPCAIQNQLIRFRAKKGISGLFASYVFRRCQQSGVFARIALQTTSIAHLGGSRFQRLLLAWPKSELEQRSIAEALCDTDALIDSLEQLIAKKRQIKQGAMQELLTGKKRLPGFGREWAERRFSDFAQLRKDRIDPRHKRVPGYCVELEHIEQGTGCLAGHSEAATAVSLKSVFQKGDVLFGKLRAYLRKYWLADRDGVCSTEIWVLVAVRSLVSPAYLFQLVKVDRFIEVASSAYGTHMPRSDWNVVKNYDVLLPCLDEQAAIANILTEMDTEIATLEVQLAKVRLIEQGMMQELLTGRIRLV